MLRPHHMLPKHNNPWPENDTRRWPAEAVLRSIAATAGFPPASRLGVDSRPDNRNHVSHNSVSPLTSGAATAHTDGMTHVLLAGWILFLALAILVVPATLSLFYFQLGRRPSGGHSPTASESLPSLSLIVAARNEEQQIAAALRSLLECDYPALQIVAVDDRSDDATGSIMDRLAEEDSRLEVQHITVLPDGWLGKNHALQVGASAAQGELLLFTDGDVVFGPQVLRSAVRTMLDRNVDHLSLTPGLVTGSFCERVLVTSFAFLFTIGCQLWLIPSRLPWFYMGVGAFNLVRREVYQAIGGHATLRFDILDDVKLGKCIKQSGYRQCLLIAADQLWVRWQQSAWGVIRGLEKNAFAAADYSIIKAAMISLLICVISILPYLIPLTVANSQSSGFLAAALLMTASYGLHSSRCGSGCLVAPALIGGGLGMLIALWRSAWITLRQRGVVWRDTFYSIGDLKANIYK